MNTYLKICFVLLAAILMTGCVSTPYYSGAPGAGTLAVMQSTEPLIDWASQGGHESKSATCSASESSYQGTRYYCSATNSGYSQTFQGQLIPPNRGVYRGPYGGRYDRSYRGSYRDDRRYRNSPYYRRQEWDVGAEAGIDGRVQLEPYIRDE